MIVTPDAPVNAVNSAHETSEMIARPPGNQPSSACESRTSRRGAWPALSMNPANVNNGIATSTGVSESWKKSIATTERPTPSLWKPSIALVPMTANYGAPSSVMTARASGSQGTSGASRAGDGVQNEAIRDQRERDRHRRLEPPSRKLAERHVAVGSRITDKDEGEIREHAAHRRREQIRADAHDQVELGRQPLQQCGHPDVPPVAARGERA